MDIKEMMQGIREIKEKTSEKSRKKLDFDLMERIMVKLDSFSDCNECRGYLDEVTKMIEKMNSNYPKNSYKEYKNLIGKITVHLKQAHGLVAEGYYTNTYMAYGVAFGMLFGVVFSQIIDQNALIGIGLPIGIAIGLSIGSSKDNQAKKEGRVI